MKKIFLTVLMGVGFLFPYFVSAQNVVGTWTWVAAGCRDTSLSASSHVTKSKRRNPFQIRASELTLKSDNSAAMTIEIQDQTQNETGNYTVENNRVVINDPKMSEDENPVLILDIVAGDLLLAFSSIAEGAPESLDDGFSSLAEEICGSEKTYVYVFSNVN